MAESYERKGDLTFGIDIKQSVHICVHKSADHFGGHSKGRGDGQQIG